MIEETFPIDKDANGLYRLGYSADFEQGGCVTLDLGGAEVESCVTVYSEDQAREFIAVRSRAAKAARWNRNVLAKANEGDDFWHMPRLKQAVKAALAWAAEGPGVHAHTTLSHHGLRPEGRVVASGVPLDRVSFIVSQNSASFYTYEPSVATELAPWFLDRPKVCGHGSEIADAIMQAVGKKPWKSWNDYRSMAFAADVHPDAYAAFSNQDCNICGFKREPGRSHFHRGTLPEGWR